MRTSLDARRPVVVYPSGGIGDHLAAMPAMRALVGLFPNLLSLICIPGSRRVLFSELGLRSVHEVSFCDVHGAGLQMAPFPPTVRLPGLFTQEAASARVGIPVKPHLSQSAQNDPWRFDPEAVAQEVGECDLMISLTPWHSSSLDELLRILSPQESVGFSTAFKVRLMPEITRNIADVFFQVPAFLEPGLKIEDFLGGPLVSAHYQEKVHRICSQLPKGRRILVVHADTFAPKMWSSENFAEVVGTFLDRHGDFFALVVGCPDADLARALSGERVVHCFPLELPTSLGLVAQADLFLGVDSCMLHCADIHLVPGVGLFGPTDPSVWGFRFAPHRHVVNGTGSMVSIRPVEVLASLESLLTKPSENGSASCRTPTVRQGIS